MIFLKLTLIIILIIPVDGLVEDLKEVQDLKDVLLTKEMQDNFDTIELAIGKN